MALPRCMLPAFSSPLQCKGDRGHQRTSGLAVICLKFNSKIILGKNFIETILQSK